MYIRLTVKSDVDFDTMCEKVVEEMGDVYSNRWVSEEVTEYSGVDALHCLSLPNLYIKIQIFLSVGFVGFALKSPLLVLHKEWIFLQELLLHFLQFRSINDIFY